MKLAEALLTRSDQQKKLASLKQRINANVLVQDGDEPSEDPNELLKQVFALTQESQKLVLAIHQTNALAKLRISDENDRIIQSLEASSWSEGDKKKALVASRYLNSVGKGDNALELCNILEENLLMVGEEKKPFNVPQYIKDAIEWLIQ